MIGKVYIIGTGPGDEELLTVKAVKILRKCTAILYDGEIHNNVLNYINENCEIYTCGNDKSYDFKKADEISKTIMKLYKKGGIIGRVCAGDPYASSEGTTQILNLSKMKIDFEVVSGVDATMALLSYAGIPIVSKGNLQNYHVIDSRWDKEKKIQWNALAKEKGTLIILVEGKNLEKIFERLKSEGKSDKTPYAIIQNELELPRDKILGRMGNFKEVLNKINSNYSYIVVIGEVVELSKRLSWLENKPFFGLNVCITKGGENNQSLKDKLKDLGAEVTEVNTVKIRETPYHLDEYIEKLRSYTHIIFTSPKSVDIFFDYLIRKKYDIRKVKSKISVVGKATKDALEERGVVPFIISKDSNGEELIKEISLYLEKGDRIMLPCSLNGRFNLKSELEKMGAFVEKVSIYNTKMGDFFNKRSFEKVDIVLFTSPNSVNNFIDMVGLEKLKLKKSFAIGPHTYKTLKDRKVNAIMCKRHNKDGFIDAISSFYNKEIKVSQR